MVQVVRCEKNMEIRIIRLQWQLHQQQRQVNYKSRQKDHAQRYRPWSGRAGLSSLHISLSVGWSWILGRRSGLYDPGRRWPS
jgi:hypothetical protein